MTTTEREKSHMSPTVFDFAVNQGCGFINSYTVSVRVDGVARKNIVPGYPGYETLCVTVLADGRAYCNGTSFGRHGYRCDSKKVRASAIRAARAEVKRRTAFGITR
jgi:hypothetical protein